MASTSSRANGIAGAAVPNRSSVCRKPQIAAQLGLCEKTVRNHLTSIFAKMQVNTRAQAIVRAREAGVGIALPANAASAHFLPDQSVIPGSFHGPLR